MHATQSSSGNTDARRLAWRTIDIIVTATLGVVSGLLFWVWDQLYNVLSVPLALTPGFVGILNGGWLFVGVLTAIIVRKPGAAIIASVIAGFIESGLGGNWGFANIPFAALQGLGAEIAVAIFAYRSSRLIVAVLGGLFSGVISAWLTLWLYYPHANGVFETFYWISTLVSAVVLAGTVPLAIARGLVRAGALRRFPIAQAPSRR